MSTIAVNQITIADLNDPIQQGTAPSSPEEGTLWLDTSITPNQLRRYEDGGWVSVGVNPSDIVRKTEIYFIDNRADLDMSNVDVGSLVYESSGLIWRYGGWDSELEEHQWDDVTELMLSEALNVALEAQRSIDSKIRSYTGAQPQIISGLTDGMLWLNTASKIVYYYSSAMWLVSSITINYVSGNEPVSSVEEGERWYDIANDQLYIYTTDWIENESITFSFVATTAPPPVVTQGDLWFSAAENNAIYRAEYNSTGALVWTKSFTNEGEAALTEDLYNVFAILFGGQSIYYGAASGGIEYVLGDLRIENGRRYIYTAVAENDQTTNQWVEQVFPVTRQLSEITKANNAISLTVEQHTSTINALGVSVNGQSNQISSIEQIADSITLQVRKFESDLADGLGAINTILDNYNVFLKIEQNSVKIGKRIFQGGIEQISPFDVRITDTELGFYENNRRIAWINNEQLFIDATHIQDILTIGRGAVSAGGEGFVDLDTKNQGLSAVWRAE